MARLVEVEVEEVSLVDRPANGRRFRIFKRAAPSRWLDGILSRETPQTEVPASAGSERTEMRAVPVSVDEASNPSDEGNEDSSLQAALKPLEAAIEALMTGVERLQTIAMAHEEQLDELMKDPVTKAESVPSARRSLDPEVDTRPSLWKGVL